MTDRPVTHADLVAHAVRWLRVALKCKPIFAEMTTAAGTTPDAIGWAWGVSRLVEVKVSRGDFFRDRHKPSARMMDGAIGRQRWYMTPAGLVLPGDLPPEWGLLHVDDGRVVEVAAAPQRELGSRAHAQETLMLASALRRAQLGSVYDPKTGRWEADRKAKQRKGGAT